MEKLRPYLSTQEGFGNPKAQKKIAAAIEMLQNKATGDTPTPTLLVVKKGCIKRPTNCLSIPFAFAFSPQNALTLRLFSIILRCLFVCNIHNAPVPQSRTIKLSLRLGDFSSPFDSAVIKLHAVVTLPSTQRFC